MARGTIRRADLEMLGYNLVRHPGDPTGIMTTQSLRYGPGQTRAHRTNVNKTGRMLQHVAQKKKYEDARIRGYLANIGQKAYARSQTGRARMGSTIGRQGSGKPNAKGQERTLLQNLYDQFQTAHDEANTANEERYQQLIEGLESRRERGLGYLQNYGLQMMQDVKDRYKQFGSDIQNKMIDSGLAGGSRADVMQQGNLREEMSSRRRLGDNLSSQYFNADMQLDLDRLQAIERREDIGPDYGMLAQLAQQIGASQSQQPQVGGGVYEQSGAAALPWGQPQLSAPPTLAAAGFGHITLPGMVGMGGGMASRTPALQRTPGSHPNRRPVLPRLPSIPMKRWWENA